MSDVAIRVAGLGKQYQIGGDRKPYKTIRESITDTVLGPLRRLRAGLSADAVNGEKAFWALKDVSFQVKNGEAVGIIGRNGAGKSTLLKILSRITEPTEGEVEIAGRVGSLLEVGTGFHPELTGRENIYLNGAILGMTRPDIKRKFDKIVEFAGVHSFLDTPVKRYSSGMYVRLAFAVAAHLEPDILLVDEVLAVGDVAFQKKCLGKMGDVMQEGRTVLLVSHNMASILSLCKTAYLLTDGKLTSWGPARKVVDDYMRHIVSVGSIPLDQRQDRRGDGGIQLTHVRVSSTDPAGIIRCDGPLKITLDYRSSEPISHISFVIGIYDYASAIEVYLLHGDVTNGIPEKLPPEGTVECQTGPLNMTPGRCYLNLAIVKGGLMSGSHLLDWVDYAAHFDVEPSASHSSGQLPPRSWSLCLLSNNWSAKGSG
jgi:homopolymeric O-antigen transport system ATP-binding protein